MDTSVLSFAVEREVEHVEYEGRGSDGAWHGSATEVQRDAIQPSNGFAWLVRIGCEVEWLLGQYYYE